MIFGFFLWSLILVFGLCHLGPFLLLCQICSLCVPSMSSPLFHFFFLLLFPELTFFPMCFRSCRVSLCFVGFFQVFLFLSFYFIILPWAHLCSHVFMFVSCFTFLCWFLSSYPLGICVTIHISFAIRIDRLLFMWQYWLSDLVRLAWYNTLAMVRLIKSVRQANVWITITSS